jgi:asparagine synthase (glutamine-hydrolysing)
VAKYLLSRAVRDAGYKVVITEKARMNPGRLRPLSPRHGALQPRGQDPPQSAASAGSEKEQSGVARAAAAARGSQPLRRVRSLLGFVPSWIETFSARSVKMRALLAGDFLERFGKREGYRAFFSDIDVRGQLTGRDPLHQSLYLWAKTGLPTYILTMLGDRMEMAHSIEGRVPFLDHHVVEVTRSQPVNQKIRGMTEKYVLREAVRDVISDTVYKRQKHPFLSPPATLNPEERLSSFVQDTLRGPVLASDSVLTSEEVMGLLDSLHTMDEGSRVANDQVLMILVSACVLHKGFHLVA